AEEQDVRVAAGGEERGPGGGAGEDRVERAGGAVHEGVGAGEQLAPVHPDLRGREVDGGEDAADRVVDHGGALDDVDLLGPAILEHQIGERAAHVGGDGVAVPGHQWSSSRAGAGILPKSKLTVRSATS